MRFPYENFNLQLSIESGQCFEWQKKGEYFYGEIKPGSILKLKQFGDSFKGYLEYEVFGKKISEEEIKRYFSLNDDYFKIVNTFLKDKYIEKAVNHLHGMRIVNQDPWRCLYSFIISANNTVLNIRNSVNRICENFGESVETDIGTIYLFPNIDRLIHVSEEVLRDLKLGFRSKYLVKLPQIVSKEYFKRFEYLDYDESKKELMKINGVGSKIADCILLYSLYKNEAYPVDVWLRRATHECYFSKEKLPNDENLRVWAREYFGKKAGIAHTFLFVYRRSIGTLTT